MATDTPGFRRMSIGRQGSGLCTAHPEGAGRAGSLTPLNLRFPHWRISMLQKAAVRLGFRQSWLARECSAEHCIGLAPSLAPYWTYFLCALGLFIYQSLDAIDGKQARRTNSCSPLGELFDHGCDSLSTVFMAIGAAVAVRLGTHPDLLFFCSFVGMFLFYCAHWQTYVSGVLRFGRVDVTEIQVALMIVFILSTFGGATMWDYTIPILEIKLKIFPVLGVVGGAIFSCSNYFHVILHGGVGKNGSTIAGTSVLSPGLHIGLIIILAIMIYKKSATNVFERHPCLYTLMFGCVFAKIAQKLVVISSFDMMTYFSSLCLQISRHLHLNIFKTSYQQAPEQVHKHID
ncbi:cholinephosphotransferase 1-like protein [Cricetulus griseus]|uniref:Cholinephosphotransferase 1 n=1 Tax=Cricetulus griseus TaxID=10029 RepID=A0A061INB0_CRIGR|nr:cholinephosphotransferase 1-like protein [Cricetulus griseus]